MWTSTTLDTISKISAATCMSSWAYLRCFMLPFCIYHCWTQGIANNLFEKEGITLPIFCFLLSLLALLHYYWLFLMGKMAVRSATEGIVEDTQNLVVPEKEDWIVLWQNLNNNDWKYLKLDWIDLLKIFLF